MACYYPLSKSSLLLFFFLTLANSGLSKSIHHIQSPVQAPSPALVGAAPPAPVEASTPVLAPVDAPSPESTLAPVDAPTQDCSPYAHGLLECLDYLQAGSSTAKPDSTCCTDLRLIVKEDVSCLCGLLTGNQNDFGFPINSSRVFSLPYTCAFTLPTSSECNTLLGGLTVAAAPGPSASEGLADAASPPLSPKSLAVALPITIFTIAAGIVVSTLSLVV